MQDPCHVQLIGKSRILGPCKIHANPRPSRIRDTRTHARSKIRAKCVAGELRASEANARSVPLQDPCQVPRARVCKTHALARLVPTRFPRNKSVCKIHAHATSVPSAMCNLAAINAHLCAKHGLSVGCDCPILSYLRLSARSCT